MESHPPLNRPCFFKASKVYWEHVGEYLQLAGVRGEIRFWYNLTKNTKGAIAICFKESLPMFRLVNALLPFLGDTKCSAFFSVFQLNTQGSQLVPYLV